MAHIQTRPRIGHHPDASTPVIAIWMLCCVLFVIPYQAQAETAGKIYFALPMEIETDFGAANGNAARLRLMPLYSYPRNEQWQLIHLDQILLADAPGGVPGQPGNPEPVSGGQATGLGDLLHASFFTPKQQGNFIWGVGAMASIPTATDSALGSGKWTAGPALRIVYRMGPWNIGGFGGNHWSFAGKSDRSNISQLLIRGTIRRQLGDRWFFVSSPIITANWKASSSNRWNIPLGGGIGRRFTLSGNPWAWSLQAYANVIKPDGAPDWSMRLALIAAIPFLGEELDGEGTR